MVSRVEEGSASLREMNSGIRREGASVCSVSAETDKQGTRGKGYIIVDISCPTGYNLNTIESIRLHRRHKRPMFINLFIILHQNCSKKTKRCVQC
jgi:hypothetical protein